MAKFEGLLPFRTALICISLLASHTMAQGSGISQTYCSDQNTGTSYGPGESNTSPCHRLRMLILSSIRPIPIHGLLLGNMSQSICIRHLARKQLLVFKLHSRSTG